LVTTQIGIVHHKDLRIEACVGWLYAEPVVLANEVITGIEQRDVHRVSP
jgi:hypothetical protein